MCKQASCEGRCFSEYKEDGLCSCDVLCVSFGDCCIDYQAECTSNTSFTSSNLTEEFLQRQELQARITCEPVKFTRDISGVPVFIPKVNKCPLSFIGNLELCENRTYSSVAADRYQSVYSDSSMLLYKNIHCALCNGENFGHLSFVPLMYYCSDMNFNILDLYREESISHMLDGIVHELSTRTGMCVEIAPLYLLKPYSHNRQCLSPVELYGRDLPSTVSAICRSYHSPIAWSHTHRTSRNGHCNYPQMSNTHDCCLNTGGVGAAFPQVWPIGEPIYGNIYIASDTRVLHDHCLVCKVGEVEDFVSNECVPVPCPVGHVADPNASCHEIFSSVPSQSGLYDEQVSIVLKLTNEPSNVPSRLAFDIKMVLPEIGTGKVVVTSDALCSMYNDQDEDVGYCFLTQIINIPVDKTLTVLHNHVNKRNFLNVLERAFGEIDQIELVNYNSSEDVHCSQGELVWLDDVALYYHALCNEVILKDKRAISVYDNMKQVSYNMASVALHLKWSVNNTRNSYVESRWQVSVKSAVCRETVDILSCEKLMISADQFNYDTFPDETTVYIDNGEAVRKLSLPNEKFLITDEGSLIICKASYESGETIVTSSVAWSLMVTFYSTNSVSTILLMVTSIALIATGTKLNVLENIAFHQCIRLLICQVVVVANHLVVAASIWCRIMGTLRHFMLLTALLGHATFAVETSCSFSTVCKMTTAPRWEFRSKLYFILTFVLSAVVVGLSNLEITENMIEYGFLFDGISCWIKPAMAQFYVVGIPVAVILAICLCYYTFALRVRISPNCVVSTDGAVYKLHRHYFLASVKLTVLIAVTWITFFLKHHDLALEYAHIVANNLQGFSLFWDFVIHRFWLNNFCHCACYSAN